MHGPKSLGFWSNITAPNSRKSYDMLVAYRQYRVICEFTDYDGYVHQQGEEWIFLGYSFLPYDNGTSLFVSLDGKQEWHIRLQGDEENEGAVISYLENYLMEVPTTLNSPEIEAIRQAYEQQLLQHHIAIEKKNIKQAWLILLGSLLCAGGGMLVVWLDGISIASLFATAFGCFALFLAIRKLTWHSSILRSYKRSDESKKITSA